MISENRAVDIRGQLRGHIAAIATGSRRVTARDLLTQVDIIRSLANVHGFNAVSAIAGRLESALGRDVCGATLICYLDALDDAVTLEPMPAQAQQALLASVALRLGR